MAVSEKMVNAAREAWSRAPNGSRIRAALEAAIAARLDPDPAGVPPSEGEVEAVIAKIAAIEIWRDHYPEGPDLVDLSRVGGNTSYGITADDVRACRASLCSTTPEPTTPAREAEQGAAVEALLEEAADFAERMTGQPWACELIERLSDALRQSSGQSAIPEGWVLLADLKRRLDYRLNDHLCGMKPEYDDSITGFNEAWDIVTKLFNEFAAPTQDERTAVPAEREG